MNGNIAYFAEGIESLGKTEKRELVSSLAILLAHLLEWRFQPDLRGPSLRRVIEAQRYKVADHLEENSALRAVWDEAVTSAYRNARVATERETGFPRSVFPVACPWSHGQMMDEAFWPEG